jgi:hypothetical protein
VTTLEGSKQKWRNRAAIGREGTSGGGTKKRREISICRGGVSNGYNKYTFDTFVFIFRCLELFLGNRDLHIGKIYIDIQQYTVYVFLIMIT